MSHPRKPTDADKEEGRQLAQLRKLHKVTQQELADHLDLSAQQVSKYERGLNRIPAGHRRRAIEYLSTSGRMPGMAEREQSPYGAPFEPAAELALVITEIRHALDRAERLARDLRRQGG